MEAKLSLDCMLLLAVIQPAHFVVMAKRVLLIIMVIGPHYNSDFQSAMMPIGVAIDPPTS